MCFFLFFNLFNHPLDIDQWVAGKHLGDAIGQVADQAFTRALGGRSLKDGIRVVAVNPGLIKTERLEALFRTTAKKRLGDAEKWQELLPDRPPPGEPQDIGNTVVFLASDLAAYITGTVVTADGGSSAS